MKNEDILSIEVDGCISVYLVRVDYIDSIPCEFLISFTLQNGNISNNPLQHSSNLHLIA